MVTTFLDFRRKEVISVKNGMKIGYVDDIRFHTQSAEVESIVVFGRLRFFGLFGREDDLVIPWKEIEVIGEDTILVRTDEIQPVKRTGKGRLNQLLS